MALQSGSRVGPYEIVAPLGAGGMGEVYRAHDPRLGRDVALKLLPDSLAHDPAGLARFRREARAVAALSHPHIVTIFTTEEANGLRFITMELIEGRTLDHLIPPMGVPLSQFFDVAIALADALGAAHQKQITHRDLKPANVMVTHSGRVKILDFGLARGGDSAETADYETTVSQVTQSGVIVGTAPYMSPEQVEARSLDGRSDLFSLGIVMYEMLTGIRPFRGETPAALMSSILKDHPRAVRDLRPDIPDGVARIIARCLEKNVRDRVQSAQELMSDLAAQRRAWESGEREGRPAVSPSVRAIAVLPFADMSPAKDQEWFCDGIAEEILSTLSQIKGLIVAARTSAFSFRGRTDDLRAIGEKLNVTTVLEGSVRRAGNRMRITVRLSDAAKGHQLWSERYDRDVADVFDVQDEIASAVAERLRIDIASDSAPRAVRHTENQEAYDLYLRGRHLWYARSKGSLMRARQSFEEATQKDPEYALPYVGLAELYAIQSLYGFEREITAGPRALAAIDRALAINDHLADAHRARGLYHLFFSWDMHAAVSSFERSAELDPTSGLTHVWLGWPAWDGREHESIAVTRRAQELDPLNPYVHSLAGGIYDAYGRGDDAIKAFDKAFELDPNYLVSLYLGGGVYSRLGRHDDALRLLGRAVELSERAPYYLSHHGWALARAGHIDQARSTLAELERRRETEYVQAIHRAIIHSALGELDRAFELLHEAVQARNCWIGSPRMPLFENFRGDRRFAEHLRRIRHVDAR